mgnify:FL=1
MSGDELPGTVGETTLSVAQMPSHTHTFDKGTYGNIAEAKGSANSGKQTTDATGGSQPHSHALEGTLDDASNLPPYYVLSFRGCPAYTLLY